MTLTKFPNVTLMTARTELDDFLKSSTPEHPLPDHLRTLVERERDTIHRELTALDNIERLAPTTPSPIVNILIDPTITTVDDADLPARVRALMKTNNRQGLQIRPTIWVPLALLLGCGAVAAYVLGLAVNPMMLSTIGMLTFVMIWMSRPNVRHHKIGFGDALAIAQHHRQTPKTTAAHARLRLRTPTQSTATQDRPAPTTSRNSRERAKRIAEVHAAVAELDQEWLDYELDLRAWFLTKPQLRNNHDPIIAAYRDAYATLRDKAGELTDAATENQIADAQLAARTALKAWHDANDFALERGVNNLSPSEAAALTRLYGLVSQLNDRSTPKAMWPQLIDAITRSMTKLATVPFALGDIAKLPVIEAESRLRELPPS